MGLMILWCSCTNGTLENADKITNIKLVSTHVETTTPSCRVVLCSTIDHFAYLSKDYTERTHILSDQKHIDTISKREVKHRAWLKQGSKIALPHKSATILRNMKHALQKSTYFATILLHNLVSDTFVSFMKYF